jgi:hypothetical protein
MSRDFKNSFYKTLNLDSETKQILKWYRKTVKELKNESEHQVKKDKKDV